MNIELGRPLAGRKAVIAGAGKGIGAAIARFFAEGGAEVVIAARTESDLDAVAGEIRAKGGVAHVVLADMGDTAQVKALAARAIDLMGGVDIAVANAAHTGSKLSLLEMEPEFWNETQNVNVVGTLTLFRALAPQMMGRPGANLIIVSSIRGLGGVANAAAYGASKAALNHLAKTLACEWGPHGIRVNGLLPGPVETDRVRAHFGGNQALYDYYTDLAPTPGWTQADDCAGPAVFLASDFAARVNGHLLVVDGGLSARNQDAFAPPQALLKPA